MSIDRTIRILEPVAANGVPGLEAAAVLDVGTADFVNYLDVEVLEGLISRGGATCRFFEGPYGSGKTHLLRLLAHRAYDRGMAVVETELSSALSLEDWHGITKHVLERITIQDGATRIRSLPNILDRLAERGVDGRRLRGAKVPHPGFREAILHKVSRQTRGRGHDLLGQFLIGEKVKVPHLKAAGLNGVRNPLSRRNAEQVLNTVVTSLHLLGVPGTVLAFDENEKTFQTSRSVVPRRIKVAANLMRRLIDSCPTGRVQAVLAVFAVLPGFLGTCSQAYPALGQRLQLRHRRVGWRSPVLPLDEVTSVSTPEEFLEAAASRLDELATEAGVQGNGLRDELVLAGQDVLGSHAGAGYRRPLMKQLAALTIRHLEN